MDLSLSEFSLTLSIGALTAFLVYHGWTVLQYIYPPLRILKINRLRKILTTNVGAVFAVSMAFALGILIEDTSKRMTYNSNTQSSFTKLLSKWELPFEQDNTLRLRSLYESNSGKYFKTNLYKNISYDTNSNAVFKQKMKNLDSAVGFLENDVGNFEKLETAKIAANSLYYFCKNMVYGSGKFQNELSSIARRIEFIRSLVLISICEIIISVGILLLVICRRKKLSGALFNKIIALSILIFIVSISGFFLLKGVYLDETESFNRRIFGYYSATLVEQ